MFDLQLSTTIGAFSLVDLIPVALVLLPTACAKEQLMGINCTFFDEFVGLGSRQFDQAVFFGSILNYQDKSSFHEFAQLIQSGQKNQMHFFDYREPHKNALVYGSLSQPKYKVNKIAFDNMIIWQGNTDRLVNQFDTLILRKLLKSK